MPGIFPASPGIRQSWANAEELCTLFRRSFAVELEPLSAGALAGRYLRRQGRSRDFEDLHPSPFTEPPAQAVADAEDADGAADMSIPFVPWVASGLDLKDFLGNEFLIWLWWKCQTAEGVVAVQWPGSNSGEVFLAIDKILDFQCAWDAGGKVNVRGHNPTSTREAAKAMQSGKWPRKAGLIVSDGEHQWELTFAADTFVCSAVAWPEIPEAENPRELMEARIRLAQQLSITMDTLFETFLRERVAENWPAVRGEIRDWIAQLQ